MTAGLFTFYGDAGWNVYPIGPYGDNENQPFVRGDFEVTRVHMPFRPFVSVSPESTGCADSCRYWLDLIYSPDVALAAPGFNSYAEALEHCQAHSADPYWTQLIGCYRKVDGSNQACIPLTQCLSTLPPPGSGPTLCDDRTNIPLTFKVTVPPEYLASATYGPMLQTAGRLAVGALGQSASGWELVPGAYTTFNLNQEEYEIGLPYMPFVPTRFVGTANAESSVQAQLYYGLYDTETKQVVGTGYYAPNAVYEDGDWFYLLIYTYNWTDPAMEGWSLGIVSSNTIYAFADPYKSVLGVTFGDNRAIQEDILPP
jgi:hypothetical protein